MNETLPYRFAVIAVDESFGWTEIERMREEWAVERVCGVYLIDTNLAVHICSLTPMIEATFVEDVIFFREDATEEQREAAHDYVLGANQDEDCTYFSGDPKSFAVEMVELDLDDHLIEDLAEVVDGGDPYDLPARAEVADRVIEWYRPNPDI